MTVTTLVPDQLYHLGTFIPLDGRLSWRAPDAVGFEPIGAYLVAQPDACVLVYTGVAAQRDQMVSDTRETVGARELSLLVDRNEADVIGNLSALTNELDVEAIWYSGAGQIVRWFTYDDENKGTYDEHPELRYMVPQAQETERIRQIFGDRPGVVHLSGGRDLSLVYTNLGTLGYSWTWDEQTGTLFTGDFFAHGASATGTDVVLTEQNDTTTFEQVRNHLFERFYWMRESRIEPLLANLDGIFATHDVRRVAPNHGCVIEGAGLVRRHLDWLRQAIESGAAEFAVRHTVEG
jgi:flavorubredoxin